MMRQDWTDRLRSRMDDYQEAVPDDLWDRIETSLPVERKKTLWMSSYNRWLSAAAVLTVVAGVGYITLFSDNETEMLSDNGKLSDDVSFAQTKDVDHEVDNRLAVQDGNGDKVREMATLSERDGESSHVNHSGNVVGKTRGGRKFTEDTDGAKNALAVVSADNSSVTSVPEEKKENTHGQTSGEKSEDKRESDVRKNNIPTNKDLITRERKNNPYHEMDDYSKEYKRGRMRRERNVNVGLYAMNGSSGENVGNGIYMTSDMQKWYQGHMANTRVTATGTKMLDFDEATHHSAPISYGLSVAMSLTDKLSLSTGLVYSKLKSDYKKVIFSENFSSEQRLVYLGVPLSVNYTFWKSKNFSAYASVGGQVDFNVSAELESNGTTQDVDKDDAQFSAKMNVGLQYNILKNLGFYIEPGMRYYFDNKSAVDNYFKEKPTNFSLQLGLRYNIK